MATYVSLYKWTDQGVRNYKDTLKRSDNFRGMVEKAGGRILQMLWTAGEYDGLSIFEAPDDETAAMLMFQASSLGNVRTTTMRAFTAETVKQIIAKGSS
jgi:uncharacterized protein with GYD domain